MVTISHAHTLAPAVVLLLNLRVEGLLLAVTKKKGVWKTEGFGHVN